MGVLNPAQISFWLGVLRTAMAQLRAVTVAEAVALAAGWSPRASPAAVTMLVVVAERLALPLPVAVCPGASVVLLTVMAPRWSSLRVTLVRATSPVLVTTYEYVMGVLRPAHISPWLGVLLTAMAQLRPIT